MKILMSMKWDGVTPDQYEELRKTVRWEYEKPEGAVAHFTGFHNNAIRVTDIWESEAQLNNFLQNRLMPGVAKLGIESHPEVDVFPLYATFLPAINSLVK